MIDIKETILSCIQPSGKMHLGNYLGAVRPWVVLQGREDVERFYGIVDMHAQTLPYRADELRANTLEMACDLFACGIDPEKSTVFIQSLVPEHAQLFWVLLCSTAFGDLTRQVQFKEKSVQTAEAKVDGFVSAGLFAYPVLQAADILSYKATLVPVGKDQEQHLELAHGVTRRFNAFAGRAVFPIPAALITEMPKVMSLADPAKKMSKSLGARHFIGLYDDEALVTDKVMSARTDSGDVPVDESGARGQGVENLLDLLRACGRPDLASEFEVGYAAGERKYAPLKRAVAEAIVTMTEPLRERRRELAANPERVRDMVMDGSARARVRAAETLAEVLDVCGLQSIANVGVHWVRSLELLLRSEDQKRSVGEAPTIGPLRGEAPRLGPRIYIRKSPG